MAEKVLIVAARFNELVTRSLVDGAVQTLKDGGLQDNQIFTTWVPGAFEIPVVAAKAARSKGFDAVICLGAVIRGNTAHFDYVAGPAASGIMNVSVETEVPVIFGVLTTDTVEQALNRAGLKLGNKGSEAAQTALQMIQTLKTVEEWSKN
ncbi:6,7-dimethyl-8-ribityllumazine synthase [Pseudobacteriovorax antillogorgiicola]|uniref:6,7-dimethyl-8-ribityllumazine synthase n=1 Tax=Pseudobacteriovorax antillogorgiicola TaxID=1513793 RepID=A0A1Y6CJY8_9BACT|nr:6,7-dimethyl-8-ribityllumazine synthase [Pseudobacteriovorax antillogorgiicola]TCS46148.1 6,7-dimethyl-8-ribityllumazine synthase [Pseudobacteriovorax antillogorgiicola]SMF69774.1 6,7-dimethyl-8-ribityllumazine synthase [Pseudobacteriovorax antillogorgiicola]